MREEYYSPGVRLVTIAVACGYLFLCVGLGGASRDNAPWNGIVQLAGLLALAVAGAARARDFLPGSARPLAEMSAALICVGAVTLIPTPPEFWTTLRGRENVARAFEAIAAPPPWLPLSLTPAATLSALLNLIPPFAIFLLACWVSWSYGIAPLAWVIPAIALASLGLGVAQVYGGDATDLYLYRISNRGLPAGIFANVNHQATLLLIAIPFAAALFHQVRSRTGHGSRGWEMPILALLMLLALAAGVLVCGSIAGYVLLLPVVLASVAMLTAGGSLQSGRSLAIFAAAFILVAGVMAGSPFVLASGTSLHGRATIYQNTWRAIQDFMPAGAGLGSFDAIYPLYENLRTPAPQFVNHAHSDALETLLELGAPGAILTVIFLTWYLQCSGKIWARARAKDVVLGKAATIAVAIILVHSLVDYPARTVTISSLAALSLAIMVRTRRDADGGKETAEDGELRGLVL